MVFRSTLHKINLQCLNHTLNEKGMSQDLFGIISSEANLTYNIHVRIKYFNVFNAIFFLSAKAFFF